MLRLLKALVAFFACVLVLVSIAVAIPFLVDLSRFKGQIQAVVAENLNARLDFDSIRLTLLPWPGLRLRGVNLVNTDSEFRETRTLAVKEAEFRFRLWELVHKRAVGSLRFQGTEIAYVSHGGRNNFLALAKPAEAKAEGPRKGSPAAGGGFDLKRDFLVEELSFREGIIKVHDVQGRARGDMSLTGVNLLVSNVGVDRDVKISLGLQAKAQVPGVIVQGPLAFEGTARVKLKGMELEEGRTRLALNLDKMAIDVKGAFVKAAGVPLHAKVEAVATPRSVRLDSLFLKLHTLELSASGGVVDFSELETTARLSLRNDDLSALGDVLPQHRPLLQRASLRLEGQLQGAFGGKHTAKGGLTLITKMQGSDLRLQAALDSLKPLRASVALASQRLDVDALVKPFLKPAEGGSPRSAPTPKSIEVAKKKTKPTPWGLSPEQKKGLEGASVSLKVDLREVRALGSVIRNVVLDAGQKGVRFSLARAGLEAFGAKLEAAAESDLGMTPPASRFSLAVKAATLDLNSLRQELAARKSASSAPVEAPPEAAPSPSAEEPLPAPLRALIAATQTRVDLDFGEIRYDKINIRPFVFQFEQQGLDVALKALRFQGLGLSFSATAQTHLGSLPPPAKFQVSLKGGKVNVDALLAEFGRGNDPAPAPSPVPQSSPGFLGLTTAQKKLLQGIQGRLTVDLGEMVARKVVVRDLVLDVEQSGLSTTLHRFGAQAMGIGLSTQGNVSLATFPPQGFVKARISAPQIHVNRLLRDLGVDTDAAPAQKAPDSGEPPRELSLSPETQKWLRALGAELEVEVGSLDYDKLHLEALALATRMANLKAEVRRFGVRGFGGQVGFAGIVNLDARPLVTYRGDFDLRNVRLEELVAFLRPEHKDLLKGSLNLGLKASGAGTTAPNVQKNLDGLGAFALLQGEMHTASVAALAGSEFDSFLGAIPLASGDLLFGADKLISNPLAQKAGVGDGLAAMKQEMQSLRKVRVSETLKEKGSTDRSLKDVKGSIKIEKGRIAITSTHRNGAGDLLLDASVGLDASLGGGARLAFSPESRKRLESQSKYATLLYDEKGNLELPMKLGGSVTAPRVALDLAPFRARVARNAKTALEAEAKERLGGTERLVREKAQAARAEAERKLREETAKKQAEVEKTQWEARKKAEAEVRRRQDEARSKAEAETNRRKDEAKKKAAQGAEKALKGFFK